jgi:hypothetical protein
MIRKNLAISFICFLSVANSPGATASGWEKALRTRLSEFLSCEDQADDASPCNRFVGKALDDVYQVSDFRDPSIKGGYLSANLIETYVTVSKDWVPLGSADQQQALNEAAATANSGRAAIAIIPGEKHGHIALLLPGFPTHSPSWKLDVLNSACFFLGHPAQSYVSDKLSKAFSSPQGVKLFARIR